MDKYSTIGRFLVVHILPTFVLLQDCSCKEDQCLTLPRFCPPNFRYIFVKSRGHIWVKSWHKGWILDNLTTKARQLGQIKTKYLTWTYFRHIKDVDWTFFGIGHIVDICWDTYIDNQHQKFLFGKLFGKRDVCHHLIRIFPWTSYTQCTKYKLKILIQRIWIRILIQNW